MIREEKKHSQEFEDVRDNNYGDFTYTVFDTLENLTLISKHCFTLFALTEENIEMVCAACTQLHHALEEGNMLGNKFKRRSILLKTLYKLVDVGSDLLSLKLAKIILAVSFSFL